MAKEIIVRLELSPGEADGLPHRGLTPRQVEIVEEALANITVRVDADSGKILEYYQDEHFSFN